VADSQGKVSAAIGPWSRGMGILNDPENKIPLENDGERWVPGKVEADSLQMPGIPLQVGWLEVPTEFSRQVSFATSEADFLLARYSTDGAVSGMPAVWMGNQPDFEECTWVESVRDVEVQPEAIIGSFRIEAADPAESVFFFVETEPGIRSGGLMVQAKVLGPGAPQQVELR
jgi:hypothetical protein